MGMRAMRRMWWSSVNLMGRIERFRMGDDEDGGAGMTWMSIAVTFLWLRLLHC